MAILKCKMCGGTIEYVHGATVGECQHCGTKQTLPNTNDEDVTNLFNRANSVLNFSLIKLWICMRRLLSKMTTRFKILQPKIIS